MPNTKNILLAAIFSGLAAMAAAGAAAGTYFQDNFDGADLSADWSVERPNADNYLVDAGGLTLLVPDGTSPEYGTAPNTIVLKKPLPEGDWKITARLILTPQTLGEQFRIGVAKDGKNGLSAVLLLDTTNYDNTNINLVGLKLSRGKTTSFGRTAYSIQGRNLEGRASVFPANIAAVDLQLEKVKHAYHARMRLEPVSPGAKGAPDGKWRDVQKLTSLRAPGDKFVLTFGSQSSIYLPHDGEALIVIDNVTIETP